MERPYKSAWSIEEALKYIKEHSDSHFAPHLVEVFQSISEEISEIQEQWHLREHHT